ncbi:outer membrane channel, putative [Syntrophotalea carbinolica DSM 2380]|uniref:Outer membrane channel, putative n=1 Tax=Syntrophotalea carbinolica (strain DSM 2380 / NBRC 103641 / GraBd1) TaxID=338963 RepID=Q3A1K7_SYNC1|nr:histidine kinase [Syntrophotalea carbinolica]ABA89750.1 outer membrane channel, putative [Syntrophotalea carbinolica DSM 2380]
MKRSIYLLCGLCFSVLLFTASSQAAVVIGTDSGWAFSTDGLINMFAAYETGDAKPDFGSGIRRGGTIVDNQEGYRERIGLVPGVLAFNIKAPTMGGLDMAARVGFYPTYDAKDVGKSKNSFGNQIDLREIFFTVDGNFGQMLIGKTLSQFQGQNLLTDMTIWGYGAQGALDGGGTPLGRIGYGYVYPQFNAQVRYTSPDLYGFKISVGLYDPSGIAGPAAKAEETKLPRFEGELSYAGTFEGGSFKTWLSGVWQEADFTSDSSFDGTVEASGIAGGIQVLYKGFDLVLSGFDNTAIGSVLMLDTDALDAAGKERDSQGFIAQLMYGFDNRFGTSKFGVSYGGNYMDETSRDKADRLLGTEVQIEEQTLWVFGIYHDINPNLKVMTEIMLTENSWFDGEDQNTELFSIGTFFVW